MSISDVDPSRDPEALAEAQLQQELLTLFVVDTQDCLQRYNQITKRLHTESWTSDVRELYRCIHTIKGGAVTVTAEAILKLATVVEDLLSDLRYLELAPPLTDGYLQQTLLETGELLASALDLPTSDESAVAQIAPILTRVQFLHGEVRERYLPTWNEQKQLHQEFADQGFDMIVLDLEIALEQAPAQGSVLEMTRTLAQQTLTQLQQVGQDLQFAVGWFQLLDQAQQLFERPENSIWRSQWLRLFHVLKTCAKQSGAPIAFELNWTEVPEEDWTANREVNSDVTLEYAPVQHQFDSLNLLDSELISELDNTSEVFSENLLDSSSDDALLDFSQPLSFLDEPEESDDLTDTSLFLDDANLAEGLVLEEDSLDFLSPASDQPDLTTTAEVGFLDRFGDESNLLDFKVDSGSDDLDWAADWSDRPSDAASDQLEQVDITVDLIQVEDLPESPNQSTDSTAPDSAQAQNLSGAQAPSAASPRHIFQAPSDRSNDLADKIQIPVPLEKLDQSAQYLIETLLTARTARGFYQTLKTQINQLVALAQEGAQHITYLRQIQDDYALLDNLRRNTQGPTPERYRQGYTTINRLLETNLRLSELGRETERVIRQTAESLQNLDSNLLKLQDTVEDSRLVPFENLSFRARAVLRDLTTRYGKPAQLVVQGEQIELDVSTARNLEPALLHLIRNACAHGLEPVDQRLIQGKPEQGTISLSLQRRGNTFQLSFQDDGRGIDAEAIRLKAEALGLPLTQTQTSAELLSVICQPGFSSEADPNDISGRGVGMDVVSAQISRIGGKLNLDTTLGVGTTFHLQFPVPHLLVPCLLLQAGDRIFAIPTESIRTTALLDSLNITFLKETNSVYSRVVESETEAVPALDLLEYWRPQTHARPLPDTAVCLHIRPQDSLQGIWLIADELLEQADLLINPLPSPLVGPDGLMGVSLQTNGTLIPVLEATALLEQLLTAPAKLPQPTEVPPSEPDVPDLEETTPTILIVDDAALIRRRLEISLHAYGYSTHTCVDGLEAWNWLQKHTPTLIITDIEMPNMDGFTLTDRCRQAKVTAPILVISSRLSEEWFTEAKRLGATDYLTKGFSTLELINKVKFLLDAAMVSTH
ncbi:response regulator [Cyanobacteria bacterium FACHB-471]|nr:response regulator [Cyanobacteria bacterium FACHB-471]